MKILIFSDIHGDSRATQKIVEQPADIYVSAGDLSTFGRGAERCGEILKPLGERLWVIPGNHETSEENAAFCRRFGFADFHRQVRPVQSSSGPVNFAGLGYSNPTPFNTPGEYTEEQIAEALAAFDGLAPLYLVVHFPPHGSQLDEVRKGMHAGSKVLREWMGRAQPRYLFCGHIHECAGRSEALGATRCFNVGKAGFLLEI